MNMDYSTQIEERWITMVYTCPNCQSAYIQEIFKYCPICGVRLNWLEKEEEK